MSFTWKPVNKPPPPDSISELSYMASKINDILLSSILKEISESTDNGGSLCMNCFSDENNCCEERENDFETATGNTNDDNFNQGLNIENPVGLCDRSRETSNSSENMADCLTSPTEFQWGIPPTATRNFSQRQNSFEKLQYELDNYFRVVKTIVRTSDSSSMDLCEELLDSGESFSKNSNANLSKHLSNCYKSGKSSAKQFSMIGKKNKKYKQLKIDNFFRKNSKFAMMPPNSSLEESIVFRGPLTLTSTTEAVSPVTLSSDWSRVARLLLLTALSVTGSVGNVFMISAVMIEDHLKKRGNSFLVNIALADILITGLVIPASTVVILADLTDAKMTVCNFQWFLALVSCLVSVLTISATAMENYARLCMSPDCYSCLTPCKITAIIILIWLTSCTAVTVQTVLRLGPDYCERTSQGLLPYQITMGVLLVLVPSALACACFSLVTFRVRTYKSIPTFRPPVTFTFDYELMKTNMYGFIFFFLFWLPFGTTLALGSIQTISQRVFYSLAWLALSKSCFLNFLYCITNRHFRNAYVNLFHYCCCKTTVSFSRRSREPVRPTGDVRVHIIPGYNMYSYTSPQRSREVTKTTCKRVGTSASCRPASTRPNGRDIYEL